VLVFGWRLFLDTNLAVVGGQRYANAASDEMKLLADELREILHRAGLASGVRGCDGSTVFRC
jgi:hypothetical protein